MDATTAPAEATNAGPDTSTPEAQATPGETPVLSLMERLRAHFAANPVTDDDEPATEPPKADEPAAQAEPAKVDEAPPAPAETPAEEAAVAPVVEPEKPAEKKVDEDLAHARTLDKLKRTVTENVTLTKRAEAAETELQTLKREAKEGNPLKLLESLTGLTLAEIMAKGAKGEYDVQTPKLPPEVQEMVEYAKQLKAREAEREKAEARQKDRATALPKFKQYLADAADKYPVLASFEDSHEMLLDAVYERIDKGEQPSLPDLCEAAEKRGLMSAAEVCGNKKLVTFLVKNNPSIKTALVEALGLNTQQPPAGPASVHEGTPPKPRPEATTPPKTLATPTEVPTRTAAKEMSEAEERAESIRLLRQGREAGLVSL